MHIDCDGRGGLHLVLELMVPLVLHNLVYDGVSSMWISGDLLKIFLRTS